MTEFGITLALALYGIIVVGRWLGKSPAIKDAATKGAANKISKWLS